jgi:hypothetical protein
MRWKLLFLASAVVAGMSAYLYLGSEGALVSGEAGASSRSESDASTDRVSETSPYAAPTNQQTFAGLDPREFSSQGAKSAAEAIWLRRSGYPSDAQAEYQTLPLARLEALAASGDIVARAILAERQLYSGDLTALARLERVAEDGSLFAMERLAIAHNSIPQIADPIAAQSWSQLSASLGNYAAPILGTSTTASGVSALLPPGISEADLIRGEAQLLAAARLEAINSVRAQRGQSPLQLMPRPGASEAYLDAQRQREQAAQRSLQIERRPPGG